MQHITYRPMAHFEENIVRDSTPNTHQIETRSSEPSPKYKCDVHPAFLKTSNSGPPSKSFRNDTSVLAHSCARFNHLRGFSSPSKVSTQSALPKIQQQFRILPGEPSQDSPLLTQPRGVEFHRLADVPTLTTFYDNIDDLSHGAEGLTNPKPYIMPLLQKTSQKDPPTTALSLSHSSLEHGGLGIIATCKRGRQSDPVVTDLASRKNIPGIHHRSTSGTSQFSSASSSSVNKPGSQNIHLMRQATRSYTPPPSQSHQASLFESDASGNRDSGEGDPLGWSGSDTFYPSVRASSGQTPRLSLQTHDNSFTRLPGISQTNVAGRSSFGYSRDNGSTLDTASPISRSSLDFVFRSRTKASTDPISRAATVQAARQAFEEKEAAKKRKFEEQQMKAEEKQIRRREKHHWRASLRDEETPSPAWEKVPQDAPNLPCGSNPISSTPQPSSNPGSWKSKPKNTWVLFLTWLRTRIFKLRRRITN